MAVEHERIVIVDYGSQYTQLIARRIREHEVFCTITTPAVDAAELRAPEVKAIILSGGPSSVYGDDAPRLPAGLLEVDVPILGICYGQQLLAQAFGGRVEPAREREFGRREIEVVGDDPLFAGTPKRQNVWMSHGDQVEDLDDAFEVIARTETCRWAGVRHKERPIYGIQFHPEVHHSEQGREIIRAFLFDVAGCRGEWRMSSFIEEQISIIRQRVGNRRVICGLSGGVDSAVAAALVERAIGARLRCIFVDNGLLRKGERAQVEAAFGERLHGGLIVADAEARFLERLRGVEDPERKRKLIGAEFIAVFEEEAHRIGGADYLVQGTLYPDVIESVSPRGGPSAVIKTHHNVGGLPERMRMKVVEPLRELFKDEVRAVGTALGLPDDIVHRQPFPGPGLAVRILGEVTHERCEVLREADAIIDQEIRKAGLYRALWQSFGVLLPVNTVGVMGDGRTYENALAIRAVESTDAMTADWARLPYEVLAVMSNRIINEVRGINRVCYDISSKPPATIEWE